VVNRRLAAGVLVLALILVLAVTGMAGTVMQITEPDIAFGSYAAFTSGVQTGTTPAYLNTSIRCNNQSGWHVTAQAPDFQTTPPNGDPIPAARLGFSFVQNGTGPGTYIYLPGSNTPATLYSGPRHNQAVPYDIYLALSLSGTESPGSYTTTVLFTLHDSP